MRLRLFALLLCVSTASVAEADKRALVMPAQLNGWFPAKKTLPADIELNISDRLRASRFEVVKPELGPAELTCFDNDCLSAILVKYGADIVVAPRLTNDEQQVTTYFGAVLVAQIPDGKMAVSKHEKQCANCSPVGAREMLVELVGQALAGPSKPPQPDKPKGGPETSTAPAKVPTGKWVLRGLGIGFAALGIAGLVQGGVEVSHDGDKVDAKGKACSVGCDYRLDTTKGQALFLSLGAALLVTGVALSVVGWLPSKRVVVAPSVSKSSAGVLVDYRF